MDWKDFALKVASSEAAIVLYIAIVLFVYRKLAISFKWDVERWEGLIAAAFNAAEKQTKFGNVKLEFALQHFAQEFPKTFGKEPSAKDLQDAALDFAKKAWDLKFAPKE
jgi:hypothetical protein